MTRRGMELLDRLRQQDAVAGMVDPRLPWGGRSPRVLTRAWQKYNFSTAAATLDEECDDEL